MKRLKEIYREIRPNFLYDITKWLVKVMLVGLAVLMAASYFFIQWLQSQPASLWAALGLFAVALLMVFTAAALVNKYQRRSQPAGAVNDSGVSQNTARDLNVESATIEELRNRVEQLEQERTITAEQHRASIQRLSDELETLKTKYKWLRELAEKDKKHISKYVYILFHRVRYEGLNELSPYIEIVFRIINASVFPITIDNDIKDGAIYLNHIELNPKMTKIDGSLQYIPRDEREPSFLVIKQWLTPTEAKHISTITSSSDDKLYFGNLRLDVRGASNDLEVEPQRLSLPSNVSLRE